MTVKIHILPWLFYYVQICTIYYCGPRPPRNEAGSMVWANGLHRSSELKLGWIKNKPLEACLTTLMMVSRVWGNETMAELHIWRDVEFKWQLWKEHVGNISESKGHFTYKPRAKTMRAQKKVSKGPPETTPKSSSSTSANWLSNWWSHPMARIACGFGSVYDGLNPKP